MNGHKILIIDDADAVRRSVVDALEPAGFSVLTASDGFKGISALQETRDLCLVIIDLNMPGLNGFGVLDWMRKDGSAHLPPAVFMTTEVNEAAVAQAKSAGALGWLVKPCRPEQLIALANRAAERRSKQQDGS